MSKSLADAKTYIARAIGGDASGNIGTQAGEALAQAMEMLSHRHNWSWLLEDTSESFTVALCTPEVGTALVTTTADGFKNVLVGMTVTGTDITAGTKVASITDTLNLVLDTAATGTTQSTLTFGGTIPIIQGTDSYTLPARVWKPLSCRLTSAVFRPLQYIHQRRWDAFTLDQTVQGAVVAYTIYNPATFLASGTQQTNIKFFRVPNQADVALFRYYRGMDPTVAAAIDVLDEYELVFLDLARIKLIEAKDARAPRLRNLLRDIEDRIQRAIEADSKEGGEDQLDRILTPGEVGRSGAVGPPFFPHGDLPWPY